jgi:hypothetical protein
VKSPFLVLADEVRDFVFFNSFSDLYINNFSLGFYNANNRFLCERSGENRLYKLKSD